MSDFGIVCEFNPIHKGHERLFAEARDRGAERIVCVMSGNAVQRGELAVFDKYVRAEAALKCGADLVLELPFPWCTASAEYFSRAGIYVLSKLCNTVIFGSECGDIARLSDVAKRAGSEEFRLEYAKRTQNGERAAEVYFDMLGSSDGKRLSSNDLLGVEYLRAAKALGCDLHFETVTRDGAGYNDTRLCETENPSATALRRLWMEGGFEDCEKYIPRRAYDVFEKAYYNGEMTDIYQLSRALLTYFRLADPKELEQYADAEGGIANRICTLAHESSSLEEMLERLSTKRYTDAKLRRAMLFSMCGVRENLLAQNPEYTTLLAANAKGREILASARKDARIPIITKPADAPLDSPQYAAGKRLDAIFTLAKMQPGESGEYMKKSAFIDITN
ncbi:MAG: nucleotidyltransferase family protein [Clostridia bacterium]|nr:nucleotidyltransferase family protein [Clostridia bacterium]